MATVVSSSRCFGGTVQTLKHHSNVLGCDMRFAAFVPDVPAPMLMFLSGLTCTQDNFITKAGAIRAASRLGLALVCPDTSPRGLGIPGEDDSYDFGTGAGFYVDATEPAWTRYRMHEYVTVELPAIVKEALPSIDTQNASVFGHSMGGHGALVCAMRNPGLFKSVSAFAPIANPTQCHWGKRAFGGYLGANQDTWNAYDATELVKKYNGPQLDILIDQGSQDQFFKDGELLPDNLVNAASNNSRVSLKYNLRDGYDHSYWFISTFIDDHIEFHHKHLCNAAVSK